MSSSFEEKTEDLKEEGGGEGNITKSTGEQYYDDDPPLLPIRSRNDRCDDEQVVIDDDIDTLLLSEEQKTDQPNRVFQIESGMRPNSADVLGRQEEDAEKGNVQLSDRDDENNRTDGATISEDQFMESLEPTQPVEKVDQQINGRGDNKCCSIGPTNHHYIESSATNSASSSSLVESFGRQLVDAFHSRTPRYDIKSEQRINGTLAERPAEQSAMRSEPMISEKVEEDKKEDNIIILTPRIDRRRDEIGNELNRKAGYKSGKRISQNDGSSYSSSLWMLKSPFEVMESEKDDKEWSTTVSLFQSLAESHEKNISLARRTIASVNKLKPFGIWKGPSKSSGDHFSLDAIDQIAENLITTRNRMIGGLYLPDTQILPLRFLSDLCDAVVQVFRNEPAWIQIQGPATVIVDPLMKKDDYENNNALKDGKQYMIHNVLSEFLIGQEESYCPKDRAAISSVVLLG